MKTQTLHPTKMSATDLLENARELGPVLSLHLEEEGATRRLLRSTINALREAALFKLFLPESIGGLEVDPLTAAKIVEEVSRYNAAAGWCLMVANTATWWCNRLTEKGVEEIYANGSDTFIAGAFHPPMKATQLDDGYIISGRSPLASNVHEAQWIFVTAFVMEEGQIKMDNGRPVMIGVFMKAEHCEIIDTWHTIGMKATDSNDVAAHDVFVPDHLSYKLAPEFRANQYYKNALYKLPAIGASVASLIAPVALAVADNAINELKHLAEKKIPFGSLVTMKEKGTIQRKLGIAEASVQSSRAYLHQMITHIWKKTQDNKMISLEERADLLLAITHTNQTCLQAVDLMYSSAGTSGIYTTSKMARYFSDANVIRQHGFANESRYETAAQIYLGLSPDLPVVLF